MKKVITAALAMAIAFSLAACSGAKHDSDSNNVDALQPVSVVLDWTPNTNHTGLYVALDKGFYQQEGLNVDIQQPPEGGALALIASGKAQFAVSFQEEIGAALSADNPLDVVAVASIIDHNLSGLISLKEAGIDSFKKLENKRYATWDTPLERAVLSDVVSGEGGDISKVEFVPNTVTDVFSALKTDVDAVWVFYAWDGIAAQVKGIDVNYLDFKASNPVFDFYTPVLASSNAYLKNSPETAKRFMRSTAKGYEYAIGNPEEAAKILLKYAPEIDEQLAIKSQQYLASQYKAEKPAWGTIDEKRWSAFYDWMYENKVISKRLGSSGFTNEFLPQ